MFFLKSNRVIIIAAMFGLIFLLGIFYLDKYLKEKRDNQRLKNIKEIQIALEEYYQKYGRYPDTSSDGCCDRWDMGYCQKDGSDGFLSVLVKEGFLDKDRGDPLFYNHCGGYLYHRFNCTIFNNKSPYYPCYGCDKPFYILGIKKLETQKMLGTIRANGSKHLSCPNRDWSKEFDYVVGEWE